MSPPFLLLLLLLICLHPTAGSTSSKGQQKAQHNDVAFCENAVSAFYVSDDISVAGANATAQIRNVTEQACLDLCTNNRDSKGRLIYCGSATYNREHSLCFIYRKSSAPDGELQRKTMSGTRYFEKFCLADDLPVDCANRMFVRLDQYILKGYAQATSTHPTMAECAAHCVREKSFVCKSAMYFYEEGECIINSESAITRPDHFMPPEDGDKVILFHNGCPSKEAPRGAMRDEVDASEDRHRRKDAQMREDGDGSDEDGEEEQSATPPSDETEGSTTNETSANQTSASQITTPAPAPPPPAIKQEEPDAPAPSSSESESQSTAPPSTPVALPKLPESRESSKRFHLKPIKTAPLSPSPPPQQQQQHNELAPPTDSPIDPPANISPLSLPGLDQSGDAFFSKWGDWTPCTQAGERRIRRRKCLDLRRCKGSLMQVDYCSRDIAPLAAAAAAAAGAASEPEGQEALSSDGASSGAGGPEGPVRNPLPIESGSGGGGPASAGGGAPPSILPPKLPQKELKPLPAGAPGRPEDIWSPWLGVCQQFASAQPCKNKEMIGFESRECIAKNPIRCQGPFFRYCSIAC